MADLNTTQNDPIRNPANALGSPSNRDKYPNPFFDLAQQYMPPTIRELFRWCTFYYYNSPIIGSSIQKISKYPITDLIIEDSNTSVQKFWQNFFSRHLPIKSKLIEANLDYFVYGNAFCSMFFPFNRFLICHNCKKSHHIKHATWKFDGGSGNFNLTCTCGHTGPSKVKDVQYKDLSAVKLIRWNPENIRIKYNEYTGRSIYMYSVPSKLRGRILGGDVDIVEDTPMVVIQAVIRNKLIRLDSTNFRHMKSPTLAEQDQGWGKPKILHVLKEMYYFYTLRRAQESIALEHIVPFDIIYPMPNAQQDPYMHTDLGSWRTKIEDVIRKHRHDPNFKAVIPIPVGFGRLGGDGKAMMLGPEISSLNQTITGGMGIPQEFVFGGLQYTGSSISLRSLENDFIQNRTEHVDLVYWIMSKVSSYAKVPVPKNIRFADFRMADDVQRNQQTLALNAAGKISDRTLLTEFGFNFELEIRRRAEEAYIQNQLNELLSKGQARIQGETQLIGAVYQQKVNDLLASLQMHQQGAPQLVGPDGQPQPQQAQAQAPGQVTEDPNAAPQGQPSVMGDAPLEQPQFVDNQQPMKDKPIKNQTPMEADINNRVNMWAAKIHKMDKGTAQQTLTELKAKLPDIGAKVEEAYHAAKS